MKIERINENQIRCTLSSFDLSVRNLNLGELAYGSEKARGLFREMIQKASNEVGFEAEDIPLMVEAIPLSNESVMLVITKIEDPEELDTRFAKFTPLSDDDSEAILDSLTNQLLEGADDLGEYLESDAQEISDEVTEYPEPESSEPAAPVKDSMRIFSFDSLDRIAEAAKVVGPVYTGENTIYKKPGTRQYYLVVKRLPGTALEFSRSCNILTEYGSKSSYTYATEAYYQEHYETIISAHALQKLAKL